MTLFIFGIHAFTFKSIEFFFNHQLRVNRLHRSVIWSLRMLTVHNCFSPGMMSLPLTSIVFEPPGTTRFDPSCLQLKNNV